MDAESWLLPGKDSCPVGQHLLPSSIDHRFIVHPAGQLEKNLVMAHLGDEERDRTQPVPGPPVPKRHRRVRKTFRRTCSSISADTNSRSMVSLPPPFRTNARNSLAYGLLWPRSMLPAPHEQPHRLREMRRLVARHRCHRFHPPRKPFARPSGEQFHRVVRRLHFKECMVCQKRNRVRQHGLAPFQRRSGMQRQGIHESRLPRVWIFAIAILHLHAQKPGLAPSPTGYLHIGSARTFIFNWLYARRNGGSMILRIDDTDLERNTEASLNSIFEGLRWLDLGWDEQYRQSERLDLHKQLAEVILAKGMAYRDFTPALGEDSERSQAVGAWLSNPGQREMSREESDRRACAGEPFVLRYRVPREIAEDVTFTDSVYGEQRKSTADIEDFALARSNGAPTYHLASCADDIELRISHIIRGQDHLTNTFKHVLIFRAAGVEPPKFAHLPLLVAPDGAKLSKRKHGPVVSVTTYRDAGFLPHAFINFLCLLGWSPKDDREVASDLPKNFLDGLV